MNYTIIENPYVGEKSIVTTRGVMTDAKVAKLNNDKKKPALVRHWEELRPVVKVATPSPAVPKDYRSLLDGVGITPVNYGQIVANSGAKKLRVNKIVNDKAKNVYNNSNKEDVVPEAPVANEQHIDIPPVQNSNPFVPNVDNSDLRGRHEKTGEIPVSEVKQALENGLPQDNNTFSYTTRSERNTTPEVKQESKAGDMDLYNNLLHNANESDDVSRQLQGARNQLSIEKEENRKLAEQYGEAVKELARLKEDIEVTKKQKEQKAKEELSITLKSIENLQKENLERTSDLTSIQSEIARLKAEKQAMEASNYE